MKNIATMRIYEIEGINTLYLLQFKCNIAFTLLCIECRPGKTPFIHVILQ